MGKAWSGEHVIGRARDCNDGNLSHIFGVLGGFASSIFLLWNAYSSVYFGNGPFSGVGLEAYRTEGQRSKRHSGMGTFTRMSQLCHFESIDHFSRRNKTDLNF